MLQPVLSYNLNSYLFNILKQDFIILLLFCLYKRNKFMYYNIVLIFSHFLHEIYLQYKVEDFLSFSEEL